MQLRKKREDNQTKSLILDAAEVVFADKGFHGSTVRDIFETANVKYGLMTYYFRSKEDLFDQTINRRIEELKRRFSDHMKHKIADCGGNPSPTDLSHAYISFLFTMATKEGAGWANYITLLAHAASFYDDDFVREVLSRFHTIIDEMVELYQIALPFAKKPIIRKNFYYLESSVLATLISRRLRSLRLQGDRTELDMDLLALDMAHFFAIGITLHQASLF